MQEFFNYEYLGTLAGLSAATIIIVKFIMSIVPLSQNQEKIVVPIVSFLLIITAAIGAKKFSIYDFPLYIINSLVVVSMTNLLKDFKVNINKLKKKE